MNEFQPGGLHGFGYNWYWGEMCWRVGEKQTLETLQHAWALRKLTVWTRWELNCKGEVPGNTSKYSAHSCFFDCWWNSLFTRLLSTLWILLSQSGWVEFCQCWVGSQLKVVCAAAASISNEWESSKWKSVKGTLLGALPSTQNAWAEARFPC